MNFLVLLSILSVGPVGNAEMPEQPEVMFLPPLPVIDSMTFGWLGSARRR